MNTVQQTTEWGETALMFAQLIVYEGRGQSSRDIVATSRKRAMFFCLEVLLTFKKRISLPSQHTCAGQYSAVGATVPFLSSWKIVFISSLLGRCVVVQLQPLAWWAQQMEQECLLIQWISLLVVHSFLPFSLRLSSGSCWLRALISSSLLPSLPHLFPKNDIRHFIARRCAKQISLQTACMVQFRAILGGKKRIYLDTARPFLFVPLYKCNMRSSFVSHPTNFR